MEVKEVEWSLKAGLVVMILGASCALAQTTTSKPAGQASTSGGNILNVNGVPITETAVNRVLSDLKNQGATITPQVKEQVVSEMVIRQVMVSEATRRGLEKSPAFTEQLEELRRRLLVETLIAEHLRSSPVTDQDERVEYARQKKLLGDGETTPQYLLSQIVLKTEQQARDVIASLKGGGNFEKLSSDSIDEAGKANGGKVGWVLPSDVLPSIGNVIVNLSKGTVAAAPIQSPAGWHVIRVDDVRPFKIPAFEESRPQIRQALQMQRRQAFVESLLKSAEIQRP